MENNLPLIIIGTGLAGYHLAKEFRQWDKTRPMILITRDDGAFYSKPQLSTAYQHNKTPEQLVISSALAMQDSLDATIYTDADVTAIDPTSQTVTVRTAHTVLTLNYDALVLAVGATPKSFPMLDGKPRHFRLNSLREYADFRKQLLSFSSCTVIGSGLVGCELAHDLKQSLSAITLITPDPHLLRGLVPACFGHSLHSIFQSLGITCWTETTLMDVQDHMNPDHFILKTTSGDITTDSLLTAIGIVPDLTLATQAGLQTHLGIVVNEYLQTHHPRIFAIGDCAQINGVCRQYVAPLLQSSRALARTLAGTPTPVIFPLMPISLKVAAYPITVLPPPPGATGEWVIESLEHHHRALFHNLDGQLLGYALSGDFTKERQQWLSAVSPQRAMSDKMPFTTSSVLSA